MSAQAHMVATMDVKYEKDFEAGVEAGDKGSATVAELHDPKVTEISESANEADHTHDTTVNDLLVPAVARGDRDAAVAALKKADAAVQVVLEKVESIGEHVEARSEAATAAAQSATDKARTLGIISGLLAPASRTHDRSSMGSTLPTQRPIRSATCAAGAWTMTRARNPQLEPVTPRAT